jgi:hypothetical protein
MSTAPNTHNADAEQVNKLARGLLPPTITDGTAGRNQTNAARLHDATVDGWQLPKRITRDGVLGDVSKAMRLARDPDAVEEAYGHPHPFLLASLATEGYQHGRDAGVDAVMERTAGVGNDRAGPVDAGVVQAASPIQVDPVYVDIQQNQAPLLDFIQFETQAGFTAQYNIINDRSRPIGRVSESDSLDLSDNQKGDFGLGSKQRDLSIYVDQIELSDFSQQATDSLGSGAVDIEETATGQRIVVHTKYTAGEVLYGDPDVGKSDGSIQASDAAPGLARIAQDRDAGASDPINGHVIDKSGFTNAADTPDLLEDIKAELTDLVTNTGASYSDMHIVTSGEFFDTLENEANPVTRLGAFDETLDFGARRINIKQGVPLDEVRAVGRTTHGEINYEGTGGAGNFDPAPGDVFIFDERYFRRRQLSPLSTVPLGRVGLADKAAMYEFSTNVSKSHGAHVKYLQGYPA